MSFNFERFIAKLEILSMEVFESKVKVIEGIRKNPEFHFTFSCLTMLGITKFSIRIVKVETTIYSKSMKIILQDRNIVLYFYYVTLN